MNLLALFVIFFRIGLVGFGGGNAMLPLVHEQLVSEHSLLDETSFVNLVALSQSTPGPFILNIATWVGYHEAGWPGALVASIGVCLPGFCLALLAAMLVARFRNTRFVSQALGFLQPVFAGLIAVTIISLIPQSVAAPFQAFLALGTFVAVGIKNLHPLYLLALGALCGILIG